MFNSLTPDWANSIRERRSSAGADCQNQAGPNIFKFILTNAKCKIATVILRMPVMPVFWTPDLKVFFFNFLLRTLVVNLIKLFLVWINSNSCKLDPFTLFNNFIYVLYKDLAYKKSKQYKKRVYYWRLFCTTLKQFNFIIKFYWQQIYKR